MWFYTLWPGCLDTLKIIKPDTLIRWHRPDSATERYKGWADRWRETPAMGDEALAALIHRDGIDILVDLAGHSEHNRLGVFARKPASVQASYIGYLNTTGLPAMDYWMTDRTANPPASQAFFTERLWFLPQCFIAYTPPVPSPPVVPPPVAENGYVTFGCYNNAAKITPRAAAVWSRLLHEVADSRLILRSAQLIDPPTADRYLKLFTDNGVSTERILLRGASDKQTYLSDFRLIDLALDPFPNNGVTTTLDCVWMGVPVVSLAGEFSVSRCGVTILTHLGHPEWIAGNEEEYLRIARELVSHRASLEATRRELRGTMARSSLCDGAAFARKFEEAFRGMWREWCG